MSAIRRRAVEPAIAGETADRRGTLPGDVSHDAPSAWREGLPQLVGQKVTLREPQLSDAAALVEALSSPEVGRFMTPPPASVRGFEHFIAWIQGERRAGRCFCLALLPAGSDRPVGLIQMRALDPSFVTAEWGFALDPRHWGTGLFIESARIAVDFAFRYLPILRLEARSSVANERGNGVMRKLGAVPEGTLRQSLEHASQRVDQVLWAMLGEEWLRAPAPAPYRMLPVPRQPEPPPGQAPARMVVRPEWCAALPVLSGRLCSVRELEVSDADGLWRLLSDPEVRRYSAPPQDPPAFERFAQWSQLQRRCGRYACFAILLAESADPVGLIQLRALDPSFRIAEWGFAIGRQYWGRGLFPDAGRLLLDFAFGTVGVRRLEARTTVANERAVRALRRLGAVFEGTLRQPFLLGGQDHDDALYSLLADDWHGPRTGPAPSGADQFAMTRCRGDKV